MSKIISGLDIARRDGFQTLHEWVLQRSRLVYERGSIPAPWNGLISGAAIQARIDFGRWLADCPLCGGSEYIDPEDPFLFCLSCGMAANNNQALPVITPDKATREKIEGVLLERPVDERKGGTDIERAIMAKPIYTGLSRSWLPHESVLVLIKQKEAIIEQEQKLKTKKGNR